MDKIVDEYGSFKKESVCSTSMSHIRSKNSKGFTLIELSIVLVIISLIVGGIIGGRSLIHSAELNQITQDVKKYTSAFNTFKLQYDALPGDMSDASAYWSDVTDGDNNGRMDTDVESLATWEHLAKAEIVPGNYPGTGNFIPGVTVPDGPLNNSGYQLHYNDNLYEVRGNNLQFEGGRDSGVGLDAGILTSVDALNIDKKIDDGLARSGFAVGLDGSGYTSCLSSNVYDKTNTAETSCRMFFFLDNNP